jgi:hypothetical protein
LDKFIDALAAETRAGIRGVAVWGSQGRAQVYATAVANDAKKLTPAFFVRLDERVAVLRAADAAAADAAAAEGAAVEGPAADLAALAEGLLLTLQTDAPHQATVVKIAVARARAGLPPLSPTEAATQRADDALPAGAEARGAQKEGQKESFNVFVNGKPAGSGTNLTQLLQGLGGEGNVLMDNLQSSIPAWASESVGVGLARAHASRCFVSWKTRALLLMQRLPLLAHPSSAPGAGAHFGQRESSDSEQARSDPCRRHAFAVRPIVRQGDFPVVLPVRSSPPHQIFFLSFSFCVFIKFCVGGVFLYATSVFHPFHVLARSFRKAR